MPRLRLPGLLAALAPVLLLSGCGGEEAAPVESAGSVPPARLAPRQALRNPPPPSAHVLALSGLEGVIGASANELTREFGQPRLDVWEGDARKLQFSGEPCVLDVYLYPAAQGAEPRATYVDARRTDGHDVDRVACVGALRRR